MKSPWRSVAAAAVVMLSVTGYTSPVSAGDGSAGESNHRAALDHDHGRRASHRGALGQVVQPPTPYSFTDTFDPECPGLTITGTHERQGVTSIRAARGTDGQAFFFKDSYRFSETWTNDATGDVIFVDTGRYVFEENSAKLVPNEDVPAELIPAGGLIGPIYLFTAKETGHETVRDGTGKVLYQTAGVKIFEQLFDTLGDSMPGGVQLSFETVKVSGPHPLDELDVCEAVGQLIASS